MTEPSLSLALSGLSTKCVPVCVRVDSLDCKTGRAEKLEPDVEPQQLLVRD